MTDIDVELINHQASTLMKRGIALMEDPRREAAIDAVHSFDEALALRRQVPAGHSPFQGYLLAACLLNRADALVRLNDAAPLAAALGSYDEAIDVLRALPMDEDPLYPRRLAIGCQNRGLALQIRGLEGDRGLAAAAFAEAIAVLERLQVQPALAIVDLRLRLAVHGRVHLAARRRSRPGTRPPDIERLPVRDAGVVCRILVVSNHGAEG